MPNGEAIHVKKWECCDINAIAIDKSPFPLCSLQVQNKLESPFNTKGVERSCDTVRNRNQKILWERVDDEEEEEGEEEKEEQERGRELIQPTLPFHPHQKEARCTFCPFSCNLQATGVKRDRGRIGLKS